MSYTGSKLKTLVVADTIGLVGAVGLAVQLHAVHLDMPTKSAPQPVQVKTIAFETTSGSIVSGLDASSFPSTFFVSSGTTASTR